MRLYGASMLERSFCCFIIFVIDFLKVLYADFPIKAIRKSKAHLKLLGSYIGKILMKDM